jgi:hypothetical protein
METFRGSAVDKDADAALVTATKCGDKHAFEKLVSRHQQRVLAVAQRITNNREDSDSTVSSTVLSGSLLPPAVRLFAPIVLLVRCLPVTDTDTRVTAIRGSREYCGLRRLTGRSAFTLVNIPRMRRIRSVRPIGNTF